jgi:hypothetical protein
MPENTTSFPVLFPSGATTLAGRVHRRADSLTERQPAVLVSGSWLTVNEQMADLYAAALAERASLPSPSTSPAGAKAVACPAMSNSPAARSPTSSPSLTSCPHGRWSAPGRLAISACARPRSSR